MLPSSATETLRDPWKLAGRTIAGRYDVRAIVAQGGAGRVYKALDRTTQCLVALKVLRPDAGADDAEPVSPSEEFERERALLTRVDHPAIVRYFDHGEVEIGHGRRTLFLALEWVEGVTLDQHLAALGPLPPAQALALLRPLLDALAAAHAAGVAHRDLKPGNVMVEGGVAAPRLRLLDFGIAKLMRPDEALGENTALTLSRNPAFSPAYAAPEQMSGAHTGPWTDVHAAALLLTHAIVGRAPFQSTEFAALLRECISLDRPTPARHGVDVGALEPVLAKALALRPQNRYANAQEFCAALDEALGSAAPASAPEPAPAPAPASAPEPEPASAPEGTRFPLEIALGVGVGAVLAVAAAVLLFR
ncbi:MAG: serine/threonine-protein kinase [Polyangiales bacterium]